MVMGIYGYVETETALSREEWETLKQNVLSQPNLLSCLNQLGQCASSKVSMDKIRSDGKMIMVSFAPESDELLIGSLAQSALQGETPEQTITRVATASITPFLPSAVFGLISLDELSAASATARSWLVSNWIYE